MLQNKFLECLLKKIDSLEIVREPFFLEKQDYEKEVGNIKNEETKKLYLYKEKCHTRYNATQKKLLEFLDLKLEKVESKRKEIEEFIKEERDAWDDLELVKILYYRALAEEINFHPCNYIRIAKGWKVVRGICSQCIQVQRIVSGTNLGCKDIDSMMHFLKISIISRDRPDPKNN